MEIEQTFWQKVGRRGPFLSGSYPSVTIYDLASEHPNSVWQSLIDYSDWISELNVSRLAKRLTRIKDVRHFQLAVEEILT